MFKGNERCMTSNVTNVNTSACVAAVKCRPVLHNCVVMFFWYSGIMDVCCLHFKIEFRSCARGRQIDAGVASFNFSLMNRFNKTEAAMQVLLPEGFPFHQFSKIFYLSVSSIRPLIWLTIMFPLNDNELFL